MTINRHNYEEYFLLYTDGELSPELQQEVEQFVAQHADLAAELQMLLDTKLPADESLLFFDKESLLKPIGESINTGNYEEKFLLYVDNELSETAKAETETFVLQHPELQETFTQIKQTKLEPEVIPHPDKASLYRKEEEEEKPVIFMRWTRMIAIAAIFMGLAVGVWNLMSGKSVTDDAITNGSATASNGTGSNTTAPANTNGNASAVANETIASSSGTEQSNKEEEKIKNINNKKDVTTNQSLAQQGITITPATQSLTNDETLYLSQYQSQQTVAVNHPAITPANVTVTTPTPVTTTASINANSKVIYKQLDTSEDEQDLEEQKAKNKSLQIASVTVEKQDLNNIVDKAKRIFGKSNDGDKIAIASFALNKKSLR